jgi:uncharacterized protein (DUF169 family)
VRFPAAPHVYAAPVTANQEMAQMLEDVLALMSAPVGLAFTEEPLPGVSPVEQAAPAGCAYWKRAAQGEVFYTTGNDHLGCPVGAYTHGAELGPDDRASLMTMIGMMTGLGYLSESEVPHIPKRSTKLSTLTYGPLARLPCEPDVVLVRTRPRGAMLLAEAAHAAGVRSEEAPVVRPACATIPRVTATKRATTSFGCIGNRVYTGLSDDEVWLAFPGHDLPTVLARLASLAEANRELEAFHRQRMTS